MIRLLAILFCTLMATACRSSPKSTRATNGADGRLLFMLIADYSKKNCRMPDNLYVLDFSSCKTGGHQTTIADLRSVSSDRKHEADFLYFGAQQRLETLDPQRIIVASPFPATSHEGRFVARASGTSEFLSESNFQQAMKANIKFGEQAAPSDGDKPSN